MRKTKIILRLLLLLVIITLVDCSQDELTTNQALTLGTWVSLDKSDTLNFTSGKDLYNSDGYMQHDHYDHQIFGDSISIRYNGKSYILVKPTMHKYLVDNDNLTIDFSNKQCYGFGKKVMTYKKEQ